MANIVEVKEILASLGCVGCWDADHAAGRIRTNGDLGGLYGLTQHQAEEGVALPILDRAFHPDDVDMVRRLRQCPSPVQGGRHIVRYRIVDANGVVRWMEGHRHVLVDRYGSLRRSMGLVFEITEQQGSLTPPQLHQFTLAGLDQLSTGLIRVCLDARALGLSEIEAELRPTLGKVIRLLSKAFRRSRLH